MVLVAVVATTALAAAYAWTREPVYVAKTQLFVSTPVAPANLTPSEIYQGGLASQTRAESYARIVSSPPVAEGVIERLGLSRTPQSVQSAITAAVPEGTVLIDLNIEGSTPAAAKDLANAVAAEFLEFVETLESAAENGADGEAGEEDASVNISISSPARLPTSSEAPSKPLYLMGGAILGLFIGFGAAALREMFDRRVRDDSVVEAIGGAPVIGHIPTDSDVKRRPIVVRNDTASVEAEAFRRLRTNLRALVLEHGRRSLLVTSAIAGEGKTHISVNVAFAFAQAGHKVVLVDADMRNGRLTQLLGLGDGPGLSEVLAEGLSELPLRREKALPLSVLERGAPPPNPSELLESNRLGSLIDSLTERADLVILDSPPLLPVSDAAIIARKTDAVLLVTRTSTRAEQLDIAAESLTAVGKEPVGAVLNGHSRPTSGYGAYTYGRDGAPDLPQPTELVWE